MRRRADILARWREAERAGDQPGFERLRAEWAGLVSPFRPAKNGQYQPVTATSSKDCVAAVAAMLVERATVGAIRPTHAAIRKASGAPATRGLLQLEAARAAKALYGVELAVSFGVSRNAMRDTVAGGHAVGVSIDTSVTRYTSRRTNFYIGGHQVYANAYSFWPAGERCACEKQTTAAHGEYAVEDPGTTSAGYLQWSADLLYRAAERRTNNGGINLLVAKDTEGRPWTVVMPGQFRASPATTAKALGALTLGHKYPGGRTENGGPWERKDGTNADGWVHLRRTTNSWAWARGEAVRVA